MAQDFVMKTLQGELTALLLLPIAAQFENLEFAQGIAEVFGVEGSANGFLMCWLLFIVAILLEKAGGFVHRHVLAKEFDGTAKAAEAHQRYV